jgi:hypothetical protein
MIPKIGLETQPNVLHQFGLREIPGQSLLVDLWELVVNIQSQKMIHLPASFLD